MKNLGLWVALGIVGLLAAVGSVASMHGQGEGERGFGGRTYVTTVTDAQGAFASRGVITLHADQTMSVIDSGQGGPTFFFTSQLGSWKPDSHGGVLARTLDFDFPPAPDVARLDYTMTFSQDRSHVTGTIILRTFPLQGDPLDGDGTVVGTFIFAGQLINPSQRYLKF